MSDVLAGLPDMLDERRERERQDAERYAALDRDACMLCGAYGADKRTLLLRYFYAIDEMVPEAISLRECADEPEATRDMYLIRTCKSCRARFLGMLRDWRAACIALRGTPMDNDGDPLERDDERDIPVRVNGATQWLTAAEWEAMHSTHTESTAP